MWILKKLFQKRDDAAKRHAADRDENGDVVKPFLDHLEDLRWMFIKVIATLCLMMTAAFCFRFQLAEVMVWPLEKAVAGARASQPVAPGASDECSCCETAAKADGTGAKRECRCHCRRGGEGFDEPLLININPIGSLSASLSLSFYAGLALSFPFLFYFVAQFTLPALTRKEKRLILPGVFIGFFLFLGGVLIAYFFVLTPMLRWLYNDALHMHTSPRWNIMDYYTIVSRMSIAIGLICELPILMVILNGLGLMSAKWVGSMRMYGYAASLALAVVIAPTTDPIMLFLFALPIMALFEVCIWIVFFFEKRREKRERLRQERLDRGDSDPNEPID